MQLAKQMQPICVLLQLSALLMMTRSCRKLWLLVLPVLAYYLAAAACFIQSLNHSALDKAVETVCWCFFVRDFGEESSLLPID